MSFDFTETMEQLCITQVLKDQLLPMEAYTNATYREKLQTLGITFSGNTEYQNGGNEVSGRFIQVKLPSNMQIVPGQHDARQMKLVQDGKQIAKMFIKMAPYETDIYFGMVKLSTAINHYNNTHLPLYGHA